MQRLISKGANPVVAPFCADDSAYGVAPLFEAAAAGEVEAVKLLIDKGADVNLIEKTDTPLDAAEYRKAKAEKTIEVLRANSAKTLHELSKRPTDKTEQVVPPNGP
jgi:ankyrin repeat protein